MIEPRRGSARPAPKRPCPRRKPARSDNTECSADGRSKPPATTAALPMLLEFDVLRFGGAVGESHVLQFALAAGIAHRAIQRMIAEQHFHHAFARLANFVGVGGDHHAFGDHRSAGGLQLRHLLDFHQAHAACALQRKIRVVAERRHFDAHGLAGFDQQRPRRRGDLLAIDSDDYISHKFVVGPWSFVVVGD